MTFIRHVSFVDCQGHDIIMATVLTGAAMKLSPTSYIRTLHIWKVWNVIWAFAALLSQPKSDFSAIVACKYVAFLSWSIKTMRSLNAVVDALLNPYLEVLELFYWYLLLSWRLRPKTHVILLLFLWAFEGCYSVTSQLKVHADDPRCLQRFQRLGKHI